MTVWKGAQPFSSIFIRSGLLGFKYTCISQPHLGNRYAAERLYIPQCASSHLELPTTKTDASTYRRLHATSLSKSCFLSNIGHSCQVHHRVFSLKLSQNINLICLTDYKRLENVFSLSRWYSLWLSPIPSLNRLRRPGTDNFLRN